MRRRSRFNSTGFKIRIGALAILAIFGGVFLIQLLDKDNDSGALSATEFKAGRIIDDSVFYNPNTMTAAEIDAFIDSHTSACDTWGTQKIGNTRFYGVQASSNTTRAEYMKYMRNAGYTQYHDAPFICIRDYYENPKTHKTNFETGGKVEPGMISAGQIIYNAAHEYNVNPQVLLVMLKKESYAWGDDWPLKFEYNTVMGYGCPDNAACDQDYFGFYNQVMTAAWQLNYYREHPNDYRYRPGRNVNIYYSPDYSCGTKSVYIENYATAGLYIYTPYTPNDAALANYPGTAWCGSYGNRNFYMYFREWFGSTEGDNAKTGIARRLKDLKSAGIEMGEAIGDISSNTYTHIYWQEYENGYIVGNDKYGYWESMGSIRDVWQVSGFEGGALGFPTSGIVTNKKTGFTYQNYQNGAVVGADDTGYWISSGKSRDVWAASGFERGALGYPISNLAKDATTGLYQQSYTNGVVEGSDKLGYWIKNEAIDNRWIELGGLTGTLGKFKSGISSNKFTGIFWIQFEKGYIVGKDSTGYWESVGKSRNVWQSSGFEGGSLGFPTGALVLDETTGIYSQTYEKGAIVGNDSKGYYILSKGIFDYWKNNNSVLGTPVGNLSNNPYTGIYWVQFEKGYIVGKDSTGYWESVGKSRNVWQSSGFEGGSLGFPTGALSYDNEAKAYIQPYERGYIVGNDSKGYHLLSKGIYDYWKKDTSKLGLPVANLDSNRYTGISWVQFENGYIVGKDSTGYWESMGKTRDIWAKSGFEGGSYGFPRGPIVYDEASGKYSQKYERGTIVVYQ
ncbi:MAG: hypothetical protein Q4A96_00045 [Candidatus Saccharibacteria bacterium]|nr:hypothetical protein [Candidatus Saccharibacteria bacterium]